MPVSTTPPLPLLINGERAQSPTRAPLGALACIDRPVEYVSEVERYVFQGWENGAKTECVTLDSSSQYRALYSQEVLLVVRSKVRAYEKSAWVSRGSLVRLAVPDLVETDPGVRFRFDEWTGGETPFSTQNAIALFRPTVLETKWTKEYQLSIEAPEGAPAGISWYPENQAVVLKAPSELYTPDRRGRLRFLRWESIGARSAVIPDVQNPVTTLVADAPHTVSPVYQREYLVVSRVPQSPVKRLWIPEGEDFMAEAPSSIDGTPGEDRWRFTGWDGADLQTPRGTVVVERPLELKALYKRQFMVRVLAPYGSSGEGWYDEGAPATIHVPQVPGGTLFFRRVFDGFPGLQASSPDLEVNVTGPLIVTALYRSSLDLVSLGAVIGALLIALAIYFFKEKMTSVVQGDTAKARRAVFSSLRPRRP
ncbi:MAG: hypothetical protein HY681_05565 [Chloroflexi bacterium]|nr:hypothetical protein [Chloroflexota bacterium]